jgi:PAS domain S-box-containing protein
MSSHEASSHPTTDEQFRLLVAAVKDYAIFLLDPDGRVMSWNAGAERIKGYREQEILGSSFTSFYLPQDIAAGVPAAALGQARENGRFEGYGWRVRKDGTRFYAHVTITALRDPGGRLWGFAKVTQDVTERRQAEQQLRESLEREQAASQHLRALDQMKSTFLQAVSHELRTPLASVLGIAVTLQHHQQQLDAGEVADLLRRLGRSALKMDRLLNDLLDLDRLAQPTVSPERQRIDLNELVRRVVNDASRELLDRRPVHVVACPLELEVDAPKVERMVENLLVNAARHTPPGTPVWVRVQPREQGALLLVEDASPGVPGHPREAIFEPFRQGPRPASHAPGVGVGLALVRVFAQLHGGNAWVEERQGGGASFRIHLPDLGSGSADR